MFIRNRAIIYDYGASFLYIFAGWACGEMKIKSEKILIFSKILWTLIIIRTFTRWLCFDFTEDKSLLTEHKHFNLLQPQTKQKTVKFLLIIYTLDNLQREQKTKQLQALTFEIKLKRRWMVKKESLQYILCASQTLTGKCNKRKWEKVFRFSHGFGRVNISCAGSFHKQKQPNLALTVFVCQQIGEECGIYWREIYYQHTVDQLLSNPSKFLFSPDNWAFGKKLHIMSLSQLHLRVHINFVITFYRLINNIHWCEHKPFLKRFSRQSWNILQLNWR